MEMKDENGWSNTNYLVTDLMIDQYAELTGDHNPIHFGPERIAHGGLLIGLVSAAIWKRFGDGTVAVSLHDTAITSSVKPDETVTVAIGEAVPDEGSSSSNLCSTKFRIRKLVNGRDRLVMRGKATIILSQDTSVRMLSAAS